MQSSVTIVCSIAFLILSYAGELQIVKLMHFAYIHHWTIEELMNQIQ